MTRDEVIKALENCMTRDNATACEDCEYKEHCASDWSETSVKLVKDALALLKDGDMVRVVRCKSCRHYNTECCADGFGWCHRRDFGTTDEWYCADGEEGTYDEG